MNHTFNTFKSPHGERSMFKNIPMSHRDHPFVQGMTAVGCRIRYRGPREHGGYHTLRERATHFSIYPPSQIREWSRENGQGWTSTTFWPWERPQRDRMKEVQDRLDLLDQQIEGVQDKIAILAAAADSAESVLVKLETDRMHLIRQRRHLQTGFSERPIVPKRERPKRQRPRRACISPKWPLTSGSAAVTGFLDID